MIRKRSEIKKLLQIKPNKNEIEFDILQICINNDEQVLTETESIITDEKTENRNRCIKRNQKVKLLKVNSITKEFSQFPFTTIARSRTKNDIH